MLQSALSSSRTVHICSMTRREYMTQSTLFEAKRLLSSLLMNLPVVRIHSQLLYFRCGITYANRIGRRVNPGIVLYNTTYLQRCKSTSGRYGL